MRRLFTRRAAAALCIALTLGFALVAVVPAQKTKSSSRTKDASRRSNEAAKVFNQIMRTPDKAIPKELLDNAEAVAVFPDVIKAAFIVGGRKGQGVISRRTPKGWGAPVFFNLAGGSFGAQIGASSTDFVLLFMNEEAMKGLVDDNFEIGGEIGVAAGPVGRTVGASTTPTLDAGILTYSRSKGAFIGASLKGVAITPDNDLNRAIYGIEASELVNKLDLRMPTAARAFPLALSRYSKK